MCINNNLGLTNCVKTQLCIMSLGNGDKHVFMILKFGFVILNVVMHFEVDAILIQLPLNVKVLISFRDNKQVVLI